jgi:hypothetical protein
MWLRFAVVSCLYCTSIMRCKNCFAAIILVALLFRCFSLIFLPINVMVACMHVDQVSGAPFWHVRSVIGVYRAGGSLVLLSARNVALLWVRMHSNLWNKFGIRRAMPVACSVQVLLFLAPQINWYLVSSLVRSLGRVTFWHTILTSTLRNFL